MLDSDALYQAWAPPESPWSPWVKPVLFAHFRSLEDEAIPDPLPAIDATWAPPADGRTAIVCNRFAATSVATGLALAQRGYRPVALFNALPHPDPWPGRAVVDVESILSELAGSARPLVALALPRAAPPAFLLDAARRTGTYSDAEFDNRSISFPSDFPSAQLLNVAGISDVLLIQDFTRTPQSDLAPALYAWQEGGLRIWTISARHDEAPQRIKVRKPAWLGRLWRWLVAALSLHGNSQRGFGGFSPQGG